MVLGNDISKGDGGCTQGWQPCMFFGLRFCSLHSLACGNSDHLAVTRFSSGSLGGTGSEYFFSTGSYRLGFAPKNYFPVVVREKFDDDISDDIF